MRHSIHRPSVASLVVAVATSCLVASAAGGQAPPPSRSAGAGPTLEGARGWVGLAAGTSAAQADGLEAGTAFGGSAAFYVSRRLGVEVGLHRRSLEAAPTSSNRLSGGSLQSTVGTASLLFRIPLAARMAPYLVAGVARFPKVSVDPAAARDLSTVNFRVTEELESRLGFSFGGGLDVLVAGRFGAFAEARYFAASTDTSVQLTDTVTGTTAGDRGSQDLNGLEIRAGLRVVF